ncbi:MAG: hypothetical protein J5756_01085 [Clostridia bacterium]|nr:hypothetical protein [Clostridia bacterium]
MDYKYGHFNNDGTEFIITRPDCPRAFDNFLFNECSQANVEQTGVGWFDYQVDEKEAIQLYTGIGRICDFDVFGRDHLMSRLIYVRDNETGEFWTVNWEPVKAKYEKFECVQGLGYSIIRNQTNGIAAEMTVFLPAGPVAAELWQLSFENVSGRPRDISVFCYNQYQFSFKWGFDSYGDMIYRSVSFDKENNAIVATKHPFIKPHNHLTAFFASDEPIAAFDGSRAAFVGRYGSLAAPDAVIAGGCTNTEGSAEATIGAAQYNFKFAAGDKKRIEVVVGVVDDASEVGAFKAKFIGRTDAMLAEVKAHFAALIGKNKATTPDEQFDRLINVWAKQANLYGAAWGRWGYNGYRDIVQQGLGCAAQIPARTREILVEALKRQYSSGLAVRGWNPIDEKAYSDSAMWLVFTLIAYLRETGDFDLLKQEVPFYDGGSATVREHIDRALTFLENNKGADRLLLIKFGDWNDSLTGTGKEGRGESVWLSIAYVEALTEMAALAHYLGEADAEADYLARMEDIKAVINDKAWDGDRYIRCIDDYGKKVGAAGAKAAEIFMEPQCWSLISGVATGERAEQVIRTCDRLLGSKYGYLLLAPCFREFDPGIGRISSMEPGIAENGTIYSHLNIWMILGLLRIGKGNLAYELFKKVSPGYLVSEDDNKDNNPPFMYANCYFGPDHKNSAYITEFSWITGSVAWFTTVLLNEMLGVKPDFGGIVIDPCLPSEFKSCTVKRVFRGAEYNISIENPKGLEKGAVSIVVDGEAIYDNRLPLFEDGKHEVKVTIS